MKKIDKIGLMAQDFKRWGKEATRRVLRGVTRHGVIFNTWFNGKKG
jgi:hypothetical protein